MAPVLQPTHTVEVCTTPLYLRPRREVKGPSPKGQSFIKLKGAPPLQSLDLFLVTDFGLCTPMAASAKGPFWATAVVPIASCHTALSLA